MKLLVYLTLFITTFYECNCWVETIPPANGEEKLASTRIITGFVDFNFKRVHLQEACRGQDEHQKDVLLLKNGAHVKNLIVGINAGNGIVCEGNCTLENVFWEDVCEDAATMKINTDKSVIMTVKGGAAFNAEDKVFQHNGAGKLVIRDFYAKNVGKLARSCGTCPSKPIQGKTFDLQNIKVDTLTSTIVGIQSNMGDKVLALKNIQVINAKKSTSEKNKAAICKIYLFQNDGKSDPLFERNGPAANLCTWGSDVTIDN